MNSFLLEKMVHKGPPLHGVGSMLQGRMIQVGSENGPQKREIFFPRGKFTPLNDKAIGKVTVPRERAEGRCPRGGFGDRVVPLSKRRFLLEDVITPLKGKIFSP